MKIFHYAAFAVSLTFCITTSVNAKGVSPYLPLKLDNLIELEIERVVSISQMPSLSKPYHIATVYQYLKKVEKSHPSLFGRVNNYIKRFKKQGGLTHRKVELAHSNDKSDQINNRGIAQDVNLSSSFSAFYQFNEYIIANAGGTLNKQSKFIPHQSYISLGYEYLQLDIGYREHWLSPMQESATIISTNAEPALSATISNVTPITDWNIKYELSVGRLEEMEGIEFDGVKSKGRPGFLTMHASLQPFDWWTLGVNRSFVFGGGERDINFSTVWKAIIDPVSGDNCGGESDLQDCNKESGNQVASITSKFDFSIGDNFPLSIYAEYAGEDTNDYKKYLLGNKAFSLGLFLPYLNEATSLYIEHTIFEDLWYVHHLYDEGYRNDLNVIGHWWGDRKSIKDGAMGNSSTLRFNWDISSNYHLQTKFRTAQIDSSIDYQYQRSKELELHLKQIYNDGFINYSVNFGKDINGESFYKLSLGYNW